MIRKFKKKYEKDLEISNQNMYLIYWAYDKCSYDLRFIHTATIPAATEMEALIKFNKEYGENNPYIGYIEERKYNNG